MSVCMCVCGHVCEKKIPKPTHTNTLVTIFFLSPSPKKREKMRKEREGNEGGKHEVSHM